MSALSNQMGFPEDSQCSAPGARGAVMVGVCYQI